jgi:hypothetical protein
MRRPRPLSPAGNLDEAQKQYENVLRLDQQMRAEGYALAAMDELVVETQAAYRTVLDEKLKQREAPGGAQGDKVMAALPEEIRNATESGIIYNPADKTCMVGGVLLKEGQKYPGYENVLVQRIEKDKIVYKVGDKNSKRRSRTPLRKENNPNHETPESTLIAAAAVWAFLTPGTQGQEANAPPSAPMTTNSR